MNRVKSNGHYLLIFALVFVGIYIVLAFGQWLLREFTGYVIPAPSLIASLLSILVVTSYFRKSEDRHPYKEEQRKLGKGSFFVWLGLTLLVAALLSVRLLVVGELDFAEVLLPAFITDFFRDNLLIFTILFALFVILAALQYFIINFGYTKLRPYAAHPNGSEDEPLFPQDGTSAPTATAEDGWQPVNDRSSGGFAVREERAPWLKWAVGLLALSLIHI